MIPSSATGNYGISVASANHSPQDNLGNHIASTTLQMGSYGINISSDISSSGTIKLKKYTEQISSDIITTDHFNIDWSSGSVYWIGLSSSTTLTFSNANVGNSLTFLIYQSSDTKTITWPTIYWPNSITPTLSTDTAKVDIISIFYTGERYYGFIGGLKY
jgi:hypothetical protein